MEIILNTIGIIGAICFALCAFPQTLHSFKAGHSRGLSALFLWLWFTGEVLTIIYVLPSWDYILLSNYLFNLLCLFVILYYKYFPRKGLGSNEI